MTPRRRGAIVECMKTRLQRLRRPEPAQPTRDLEVDEALLRHLYDVFQPDPPRASESLDDLRVRAGQQQVLEYLVAMDARARDRESG